MVTSNGPRDAIVWILDENAPRSALLSGADAPRPVLYALDAGTLDVEFVVTDFAKNVTIRYRGILPDLFREEQGIVALGKLNDEGVLVADEVLAKHDENYMPPEVTKALKESGKLPADAEVKP